MNVRSLSHFGNRGHGFAVLAGTLIVMTASPQAQAADRLVPSQYSTIQRAVDAAQSGDTVIVADGNWRLTGNTNLSFKGKAITVRSASGDPTKCSIDGSGSSAPCVSFTSGEGAGSVLRGFTLKGGTSGSGLAGGGIACLNSSPTITDCILTNNRSNTNGGGIGCTNSNPTITSCQFDANTAAQYGGGMWVDGDSRPIVHGCWFTANTAQYGGAVANYNNGLFPPYRHSASIVGCYFSRNVASAYGGAIYQHLLDSGYLDQNHISRCTFIGNSAPRGGAIASWAGISVIANCEFNGNRASSEGSAIINWNNMTSVLNCTFTNNASSGASPVAVITSWAQDAPLEIVSSIIFGNPGYPIEEKSNPRRLSVSYSNIQGGWQGGGNINSDPRFLRNPSAGPDGLWYTTDDDPGNLRLHPLSPCIGHGSLGGYFGGSGDTDLVGLPRVADDLVDMGAYEFQNSAPVARNDTYTFKVGALMYLDVLANDSDVDTDALTITSVTHPGAFSAIVDSTRKRIVTRSFNTGTYTVRYSISDGRGGTATASLTMIVTP